MSKEIVLRRQQATATNSPAEPVFLADERLESWKQIASHLRRDVRTVQLWEKTEGLPVHRHFHRKLSTVFAFRSEIDAWRRRNSKGPVPDSPAVPRPPQPESAPQRIIVAVLPFESVSGSKELQEFSQGMTCETIGVLGRLSPAQLGVISRASVIPYRDTIDCADRLGRELGVSYVIEGSTRAHAGQVKMDVALVSVQDRTLQWSQSYSGKVKKALEFQTQAAQQIAHGVSTRLLNLGASTLDSRFPGRSTSREVYLQGRYFWGQRNEEAMRKAIRYFESAIGEDPDFAPAYSGLADCLTLLAFYEISPPSVVMPAARRAALKAIELAPSLAEAHASLADIFLHFDRDWVNADREYQTAIECNPGYALSYHWYANLLAAKGQHDAARAAIRRALDINPISLITIVWAGVMAHFARRYQEAIGYYHKALELDSHFVWAHMYMALALEQTGAIEEALREFDTVIGLTGGNNCVKAMKAHAHTLSGNKPAALQILGELTGSTAQGYVPSYDIAATYAALGDPGQSVAWLQKACADHNMKLFALVQDPRFDPLRSRSEFKRVINQVWPVKLLSNHEPRLARS